MTRAYDGTDYLPSAPVIDVFLSSPGDSDMRVSAVALADTGADVTVLAAGIPSRLGLPLVGKTEVVGVDEEARLTAVWRVDLDMSHLGRITVEAVELGSTTLLGRDVLNQLSLHFNGPGELLRNL